MRPTPDDVTAAFSDLLGEVVIVDTDEPVLYIGRLQEANPVLLTLADADVHECDSTSSRTREVYAMEAARNGVHPSRSRVRVLMSRVLSVSRLDEVILY